MTGDSNKKPDGMFKDCDSAFVFEQVRKNLNTGERRALWRRIESEMQKGGVGAADSYLRSTFSELMEPLRNDVSRLTESVEE